MIRTPDTAHLSPEDAELVRALYLERWAGLSPAELTRVRAARYVADDELERRADRHAGHAA